jgi:outer membrane protein TolC
MLLIVPLFPIVLSACASSWGEDYNRLEAELDRLPPRSSGLDRAERPSVARLDAAGELDLETVLQVALADNPELREVAGRARAGFHAIQRDRALDDPLLRLRTEGTPIRQPTGFSRADQNALAIEQRIPFPGNLNLRGEAALQEAESLKETARSRERDIVARVKHAYYDYFTARKEFETHQEHIRILEGFERISEVRFRTGAVSQQDVLKPQIEIVLLQTDVLSARQRIESAQAMLNALLGRPAEAPLGVPREPESSTVPVPALPDLSEAASKGHPDLLVAARRVDSVRSGLALARRESNLPEFTVGVEYIQMDERPDGWGAMLGVNLPWFTGKRQAEARRLEETLRAEEAARDAVHARVQAELRDGYARVDATGKVLRILRDELLPKTTQTVEVSRAGYERGQTGFLDLLDAERSLRDVRLRIYQAVSMHESARADLERAAGFELGRK